MYTKFYNLYISNINIRSIYRIIGILKTRRGHVM